MIPATPQWDPEWDRLIKVAAGRYARKSWWAEPQELYQTGALAVCRALRTYDPEQGPRVPYVWRAIVLAMSNALWKESSPVHTRSNHKPDQQYTRVELVIGDPAEDDTRGRHFAASSEHAWYVAGFAAPPATPDEEAMRHAHADRVRRRLGEIAPPTLEGEAAVAVILERASEPHLTAARLCQCCVDDAVAETLECAALDPVLYELSKERLP